MVIAPKFHMVQIGRFQTLFRESVKFWKSTISDDERWEDAPHFTCYKSKTKGTDIYGYFFEVFPECNSCFNSFVSLSTAPWCFFFRFFVTIKSGGFFWKYLWLSLSKSWTLFDPLLHFFSSFWSSQSTLFQSESKRIRMTTYTFEFAIMICRNYGS